MKQVVTASDIPNGPHWVMIELRTENVYHEGDERSRNNPGHGYPAYTETLHMMDMTVFTDESEWRKVVGASFQIKKNVIAYHVDKVAKLQLETRVDFT